MRRPFLFSLFVAFALLGASLAHAAELSFVSGGFKSSASEVGEVENDVIEVSVGGRYLEMIDEESAVYYDAGLSYRSFDGDSDLDGAIGFTLGIGSRFYGVSFSERIIPFINAFAALVNSQTYNDAITASYDSFSIDYGLGIGMRFGFYEGLFFELGTDIFKSAIWKNTTTKVNGVETTVSNFEIFAATAKDNAFGSINLSFGITL